MARKRLLDGLHSIFSARSTEIRRKRPERTCRRPGLESLERRELFAGLALSVTADLGNLATPVARTATLGDSAAGNREVELYKFTLSAGSVVTATTSRPSAATPTTDTYLRLFDANGRQLAFNDDSNGSVYSALVFSPTADGTYYLGVSGYGNHRYDPATAAGLAAGTTGTFALSISATRPEPLPVTRDWQALNRAFQIDATIGDSNRGAKEVDLYRVDLQAGATLSVATARPVGTPASTPHLDTYVRLFDATGKQLAYDDDSAGNGYSRLTFTASRSGIYYIGVSEFGNRTYQPLTGASLANGKTGVYALTATVTGNNRAPELTAVDQVMASFRGPATVPVTTRDANGDPVTLLAEVVRGAGVVATINDQGQIMAAPNGFVGDAVVRVTASDGTASTARDITFRFEYDPIQLNGRDIVISGTEQSDQVLVTLADGNFVVEARTGDLRQVRTFAAATVDRVLGSLGGGDDVFYNSTGLTSNIDAGSGHDVVRGSTGTDILNGGLGDDVLIGGGGNDTIHGGEGRNIVSGDSFTPHVPTFSLTSTGDWGRLAATRNHVVDSLYKLFHETLTLDDRVAIRARIAEMNQPTALGLRGLLGDAGDFISSTLNYAINAVGNPRATWSVDLDDVKELGVKLANGAKDVRAAIFNVGGELSRTIVESLNLCAHAFGGFFERLENARTLGDYAEALGLFVRDLYAAVFTAATDFAVDIYSDIFGVIFGQRLSSEEIAFAHTIFGADKINLRDTMVINTHLQSLGFLGGMVGGNVIYFSGEPLQIPDLFAHELTHIYQDQAAQGNSTPQALQQNVHGWFGGDDYNPYEVIAAENKHWNDLNPEQQAELVQIFFLRFGNNLSDLVQLRKIQAYPNNCNLKGTDPDRDKYLYDVMRQADLFSMRRVDYAIRMPAEMQTILGPLNSQATINGQAAFFGHWHNSYVGLVLYGDWPGEEGMRTQIMRDHRDRAIPYMMSVVLGNVDHESLVPGYEHINKKYGDFRNEWIWDARDGVSYSAVLAKMQTLKADVIRENELRAAAMSTAVNEMERVLGSVNYEATGPRGEPAFYGHWRNRYAGDVRNGLSASELRLRIVNDLTASQSTSWTIEGSEHKVFRGVDGHVRQLNRARGTNTWNVVNLTGDYGFTPAAGNPDTYEWTRENSMHIVYRGTDNHLHQLSLRSGGSWQHVNLSRDYGFPMPSDDHVIGRESNGEQRITYLSGARLVQLGLASGSRWRRIS